MQFSTDVQVSKNAKDLILNLCTSSQARIGYEGLTCHQFFTGTDWNNLQNCKFNAKSVPHFPRKRHRKLERAQLAQAQCLALLDH